MIFDFSLYVDHTFYDQWISDTAGLAVACSHACQFGTMLHWTCHSGLLSTCITRDTSNSPSDQSYILQVWRITVPYFESFCWAVVIAEKFRHHLGAPKLRKLRLSGTDLPFETRFMTDLIIVLQSLCIFDKIVFLAQTKSGSAKFITLILDHTLYTK